MHDLLNPKLLILVTEDWYFMSHRVSLAKAAKKNGFSITVVTQVNKYSTVIKNMGFHLIPIIFARSLKRPWQDLITLRSIYKIYTKEDPDLIHQISLKPILYGSIIRGLMSRRKKCICINTFTGLGYVFTSSQLSAKLVRLLLLPILKFLLQQDNNYHVFQNEDDRQELIKLGIVRKEKSYLIPGSGVDTDRFMPTGLPDDIPVCMFVARMLYDKGVEDFMAAAKILRSRNIHARFILVGEPDPENPASIQPDLLDIWCQEDMLEWWGRREDMPDVYEQAHVIILPSHREGFPKTIIEASACARPVITTDVPGCRDAIEAGITGLLVPVKDPESLAEAMQELIQDREKCLTMGENGRKLVEDKFSSDVINPQFIQLYHKLLETNARSI